VRDLQRTIADRIAYQDQPSTVKENLDGGNEADAKRREREERADDMAARTGEVREIGHEYDRECACVGGAHQPAQGSVSRRQRDLRGIDHAGRKRIWTSRTMQRCTNCPRASMIGCQVPSVQSYGTYVGETSSDFFV